MIINKSTGFSLIELMIVVAIIGILAAVAYPAYTSFIVKSNRGDAYTAINEALRQQERYYVDNYTYAANLSTLAAYTVNSPTSTGGHYTISSSVCTAGTIAECVLITATPVAGGTQDGDGNIALDSRGNKTGKWK